MREPHRQGVINEAGKELLSSLSVYQANLGNSWFVKFQKLVGERARAAYPEEDGVDEKWTAVSGTLIDSPDSKWAM